MDCLSKSSYCRGVQCPKMLWLKKYRPEVFDESVLRRSVLDTGSAVGDLAMGLFGDFTEVPFGDPGAMVAETERLLSAGTKVIAEASFAADGLFCSVDILKNLGGGAVELYEVKSSTKVTGIYRHDLAFQVYVLTRCGYQVQRSCLVLLNRGYERMGALDLQQLFTIEDLTEEARSMHGDVENRIGALRRCLARTEEPADEIGMQCFDPYACGFFSWCTRQLPRPNVFSLAGLRKSAKFQLCRQGLAGFAELEASGQLKAPQLQQVRHELGEETAPFLDRRQIRDFLRTLSYPLYFLDFESFQPAVPPYDHTRPYQQIVFQYSLHWIECEGGALQHRAFLARPGADPRRALAEQLCRDIPRDVCTTAYNMAFEKSRIRELAALYPDLREHLMNIHDRIADLLIPFRRRWYYCRAMQGSYSIKYVLPALFPDDPALDYHHLEGVHNGTEASDTFARMAAMTPEELETARGQLLRYCGLDTFAMVKVWEKLKEV